MIGLTRQAAAPVRAKAAVRSRAAARRIRHARTHGVGSTAVAHSGRPVSPSRAGTPWSDWLET
ncbi:hypothetical protein [Streptomyces misionensis]|uniref:hypothetical protein n=1 Tax=Streptomyces misionensis TaxID=67331 RepID=UPI0036785B55